MPTAFIVLDAFPFDVVDADITPTLASLAAEGGWNPSGGVSEMTSATYPNHATFVTGQTTGQLDMLVNSVWRDGAWVDAEAVGPRASTVFDACTSLGLASLALVGDQKLIGVCDANAATSHWPPNGKIPDGTERNPGGYIADDEVAAAAHRFDAAGVDLLFAQLDSVDAVRHLRGSRNDAVTDQCRATDAALGRLLEPLRSRWDDWTVIVVSDHDQEDINADAWVDLATALDSDAFGPDVAWRGQGTAALVIGDDIAPQLALIEGVEGVIPIDRQRHVVWGGPLATFGPRPPGHAGDHGGPRTRTQLAVVGGGHPRAAGLARTITERRPQAREWAGHVASSLGIAFDSSFGTGLAEGS